MIPRVQRGVGRAGAGSGRGAGCAGDDARPQPLLPSCPFPISVLILPEFGLLLASGVVGEAVVFLVFKLKIAWNRLFAFPGVCFSFQAEARVITTQAAIKSCCKPCAEAVGVLRACDS